jgi:hypothetical protein
MSFVRADVRSGEISKPADGTLKQSKGQQCRSQHIEAKEPIRKRPNQSGKCGEVAADASLSFKNTMPPGFTMISGWP